MGKYCVIEHFISVECSQMTLTIFVCQYTFIPIHVIYIYIYVHAYICTLKHIFHIYRYMALCHVRVAKGFSRLAIEPKL